MQDLDTRFLDDVLITSTKDIDDGEYSNQQLKPVQFIKN